MTQLVASDHARARVRAFLSQNDNDSESDAPSLKRPRTGNQENDSESEVDDGEFLRSSRPARLGLGAKFDPRAHRPELKEDDRRIVGGIRAAAAREATRVQEEEGRRQSSDDEEEKDSKALRLKSTKKRRRAKKTRDSVPAKLTSKPVEKNRVECGKDETPASPHGVTHVKGQSTTAKRAVFAPVRTKVDAKFGPSMPTSGSVKNVPEEDKFSKRPRKRTKTRSRQKNLRKDTRPKGKLPAHLNEETLKKRLKRDITPAQDLAQDEELGGRSGILPWFEDRMKGTSQD